MVKTFPIALGAGEITDEIEHDLADAWHIAVQGQTRSGKSVFTYNVLGQVSKLYEEIRVCGSDKTGVLLRPFVEERLTPSDWIAWGTKDPESHVLVLEKVLAEMEKRVDSLYPRGTDKLEDFTVEEPLLLLVLEEFPGLLKFLGSDDKKNGRKAGERLRDRAESAMEILVAEGAKVGVRVLLLAQRFEASVIGGEARSNFGLRVTHRVDNKDSARMLHPTITDDEVEKVQLFLPGQAFIDRPGVRRELFRSYYVGYRDWLRWIIEPPEPVAIRPDDDDLDLYGVIPDHEEDI